MTLRLPPGTTVCAPEGEIVPFAPAEMSIVNPAPQAPVPRHRGLEGSLFAHCGSEVQAAHEFVA